MMRGMPLTSSGEICVPSSDRHGSPASAARLGHDGRLAHAGRGL